MQTINFETINKIKGKKFLIPGVIILISVLIAFNLTYKPASKDVAALKKEVRQREKMNKLARTIAADKIELCKHRSRSAASSEVDWLVTTVTELAGESDVKVVSVDSYTPTQEGDYTYIRCKIDLEAPYDNLAEFLAQVESQKEFIEIDGLFIKSQITEELERSGRQGSAARDKTEYEELTRWRKQVWVRGSITFKSFFIL